MASCIVDVAARRFLCSPSVGTWLLPNLRKDVNSKVSRRLSQTKARVRVRINSSAPPLSLAQIEPLNLEETKTAFFAEDFGEAPTFVYSVPDEHVTDYFTKNSNVEFELLPAATRTLERARAAYGSRRNFMRQVYGDEMCSVEELQILVVAYLVDLQIEDQVEVRVFDGMSSAASVSTRRQVTDKFVVKLRNRPCPRRMIQGICDHEIGTHLLRMKNDEQQVWHGGRARFGLANPWITEEGLATLNTCRSIPNKLLYTQALHYYAACRGANLGFVELFHDLMLYVDDADLCWHLCCRVKRGMSDTSQKGALNIGQMYFRGAMEILQHLHEVDFRALYSGQIALQDVTRVQNILRKNMVVKFPRFLETDAHVLAYREHCFAVLREIEAVVDSVSFYRFSSGAPLARRASLVSARPRKSRGWSCASVTLTGADLNPCTDTELESLLESLPGHLKQLKLDLSGCKKLEDSRMEIIVRRLPVRLQSLVLDFRLCWHLTDRFFATLASCFPSHLEGLSIKNLGSCKQFMDSSMNTLVSFFPFSLRRLSLDVRYSKNLTEPSLDALLGGLTEGLEDLDLDLSYCPGLSNDCITSFVRKLPPSLLKWSCVTDHGVAEFFQGERYGLLS
eukprot:TRINITY_DN6988_c0_g2_i1.p1 TRINITY_DN6988_c0_g2~~TRINITY_DN6988_c0_g2_i1.p1  ORF type:complete len:633 (-),score=67.28 TRINITY_DN6988_c0_g2_i1:73-1935(-)